MQHSYDEAISKAARRAAKPFAPPGELLADCGRASSADGFAGDRALRSSASTTTRPARPSADAESPKAALPSATSAVSRRSRCTAASPDWVAEIRRLRDDGETTLFVAATPGRAERTIELLKEYDVFAVPVERADDARYAAVLVAIGNLSRGFRLPDAGLQIYAEADVFEEERRAPERRRSATKAFLSDLRDLKVGDLVVHVDHGIGMFVGLKQIGVGDDACRSSWSSATPARTSSSCRSSGSISSRSTPARRGRRSIGSAARRGSARRRKVKKAMRDMAEELLKLYAARKAVPGHAFSADSHWQQEFEDAFEYELTADQKTAIADIKRDMESPTPMDRLLCGDVGYGKTEVAMRAAFKAVMDGKQVAFLAPTTVLAFQHQKTLRERFAGFPVRIDMVSRFRTKAEQKETLADLAAGKVDIIVGTHRLLSKDVEFRDLGLLVVDEEQRFGVAHKEKIKQLRKKVDVLTMTRDADSADAEHVARRHPRHVDHRDAAERSPVDPDQRREVRSGGDPPGDPQRARARRPGVFRPQPGRVDLLDRQSRAAARARGAGRRRPRPDGRGRARAGDARFRRAQVRRPARDDDRRERPRHPEREHDHHQSRRSLRSVAAVSAPRPRRPIRSARRTRIC